MTQKNKNKKTFSNRDGMYARVNGRLKVFQGNRKIDAFSVRYRSFVSDY